MFDPHNAAHVANLAIARDSVGLVHGETPMSYEELLEGLNLSESAKSQIVALGAYALSTEYIEQLRKDAIVNANCARSYADDYNQAQATLFSSNASFGFRLADELERAALLVSITTSNKA